MIRVEISKRDNRKTREKINEIMKEFVHKKRSAKWTNLQLHTPRKNNSEDSNIAIENESEESIFQAENPKIPHTQTLLG